MSDPRAPSASGNPAGKPPGTTCKRIPCPGCGEPFGNLPNHLPCDGGNDA